jgi:hypothetical protein
MNYPRQTVYTIKQAASRSGVPEASLRAWERRYAVPAPRRTPNGYRIYDDDDVAAAATMRGLVQAGWAAAEAARAVRERAVPVVAPPGLQAADLVAADAGSSGPSATGTTPEGWGEAVACMELFLRSAARVDPVGVEESLDQGFALGSFEHVADSWLFPTLEAIGEGWVRGEIDVAAEHMVSYAVQRRLAAAFQAAGSRSRGPSVVVGLPPGSRHELGALAFATAIRRRGLDVLYLGADVPAASWHSAVVTRAARAAVVAVVTPADRPPAAAVAQRLTADVPELVVASGGAAGARIAPGVHTLASTIGAAAQELVDLVHP